MSAALIDLRKRLASVTASSNQYRAALDAGGDPCEIHVDQRDRRANAPVLEGELKAVPAAQRISVAEIQIDDRGGRRLCGCREADADDKADLYTQLGAEAHVLPRKAICGGPD